MEVTVLNSIFSHFLISTDRCKTTSLSLFFNREQKLFLVLIYLEASKNDGVVFCHHLTIKSSNMRLSTKPTFILLILSVIGFINCFTSVAQDAPTPTPYICPPCPYDCHDQAWSASRFVVRLLIRHKNSVVML